jgi:hypothetical protein
MEPMDKINPLYYKVEGVEASITFDEVIQILEAPTLERSKQGDLFPFRNFVMIIYLMVWKVKKCWMF